MQNFYPKEIFVDQEVRDLPRTQKILDTLSHLPVTFVKDRSEIKIPKSHDHAKKQLYLSKFIGQPIKSCQGMGDYVCCQYYTISLVSDCHLECTYCILQDYLKNNPVITFYMNTEEIFGAISERVRKNPDKIFRIGTGELSDSLALDHMTKFSEEYVSFANQHKNVLIELKTKTANIEQLLTLKHNKNVIISWSINPESYIRREEFKCDDLNTRLEAAEKCAQAGYPVAFHFDPLLYDEGWQEKYDEVTDLLAEKFTSKDIAWISLGSLRFTRNLKSISQERFPKSRIMTQEMYPSQDGKTRYYRPMREEMYRFMKEQIQNKLNKVPFYLCMETKAVWKKVFDDLPETNRHLENYLSENFYKELGLPTQESYQPK